MYLPTQKYSQPARHSDVLSRYLVAVVSVGVAVMLRILLRAFVNDDSAFALLTLAVMFSAWNGGFRPGLAATAIGALAGMYFLLAPIYSLKLAETRQALTVGLFVTEGVTISWLAEVLHEANRQAQTNARRTLNILTRINDGFMAIDRDLRLEYVNAAADRMLGESGHLVLGDSVIQAFKGFLDPPLAPALREAIRDGRQYSFETYQPSSGRYYEITVYPSPSGASLYAMDISARRKATEEREKVVEQLRGLLPICAQCKNIRDDSGYWHQVEEYVSSHSEAEFSHSICPDCIRILYPELTELRSAPVKSDKGASEPRRYGPGRNLS